VGLRDIETAARDTRKRFKGVCDWPYWQGPAHPGHARCIRRRKQGEAKVRQAKYRAKKEAERKQSALIALVAKSTTEHRRK